jgi:hypothetical protein
MGLGNPAALMNLAFTSYDVRDPSKNSMVANVCAGGVCQVAEMVQMMTISPYIGLLNLFGPSEGPQGPTTTSTIGALHPELGFSIKSRPSEPTYLQCMFAPSSAMPEVPGAAPEQPDAPPGLPPPGANQSGRSLIDGLSLLLDYPPAALGCLINKWVNY